MSTKALIASMVLTWAVGAVIIWRIGASQIDIYGLERTEATWTSGDPIVLAPALLTVPLAVLAAWSIHRSNHRWPLSISAALTAVVLAAAVPVSVLMFRVAGDQSPVETFEVDFAWFVYALTASLHATVYALAAWRLR